MIYYLFLAIIDIGWYLWENKINLTFTLVASGIGIILGKRLGTRIAINYALKRFGLTRKSTMEQQVEWLIQQEESRGNVWVTSTRKSWIADRLSLKKLFLSSLRGIPRENRRKRNMSKFKSRKFIVALVGGILIILNEGLDMGIDSETVLAFAGLLAVWISGESYVDGKRAEGVTTNEPDYTKADITGE